jgi:hypothetical protein
LSPIKLDGEYRNRGDAAGIQSRLIWKVNDVKKRLKHDSWPGELYKAKLDLDLHGSTRGKIIKGLPSKGAFLMMPAGYVSGRI